MTTKVYAFYSYPLAEMKQKFDAIIKREGGVVALQDDRSKFLADKMDTSDGCWCAVFPEWPDKSVERDLLEAGFVYVGIS